MAHDVFISYSSKDSRMAEKICAALRTRGIGYWIATKDVVAGDLFDEEVLNGIGHCQIVLLVFSSHADKSRHVKRELQIAVELKKAIIPFRPENVEPSGLRYYLTGVQWQTARIKRLNESLDVLASTIQLRIGEKNTRALTEEVTRVLGRGRLRKAFTASLIAVSLCAVVFLAVKGSKLTIVPTLTPGLKVNDRLMARF